jgi:hypothetical protein
MRLHKPRSKRRKAQVTSHLPKMTKEFKAPGEGEEKEKGKGKEEKRPRPRGTHPLPAQRALLTPHRKTAATRAQEDTAADEKGASSHLTL